MEIRFNKKSVKAINKWLKKCGFGAKCKLVKSGDLEFDPNDNLILVPKTYDDEPDAAFMKCLRRLGLASDYDAVTLSILHELGHAETFPFFTDNEWIRCSLDKFTVNDCFEYWNIKDELAANRWAVMYADSCTKKVEKLETIIEENVKFG